MGHSIKIGDKVRYVYTDYFSAMKADYTQPFDWYPPKENHKSVMIGGEYTVIDKKKFHIFWKLYKLDICNLWVYSSDLKLSRDLELCPFKVDDEVIFKPKCTEKEIRYLLIYPTLKINQKYKVVRVINDYYVIIDTPYPEVWREQMKELHESMTKAQREFAELMALKYPNRKRITPDNIPHESWPLRWIDLERA